MKAQTPFWPLLKNEMKLSWAGNRWGTAAGVLGYWFCAGAFPLVALYGNYNAQADITVMFRTGFLPIMFFLLVMGLTIWTTFVTVPAFSDWMAASEQSGGAVQNIGALEYMFTRAVDRRKLFRARAAVFLFIALAPFLFDLAVSCFTPPVDGSPSVYGEDHARYLKAFPGYHPEASTADHMVIPHGASIFSAWLAWSAMLLFLLLQGYGAMIAKRVKAGNLWTFLYPGVPILALMLAFGLSSKYYKSNLGEVGENNLCENSFLFFATHPVAMVAGLAVLTVVLQRWCEQRFSELEIL